MLRLQVDDKTINSEKELPKQMASEQKKRYWDFFNSGATVVCADRVLSMAIKEVKKAMSQHQIRKPLVLTQDSICISGDAHIIVYFEGFAIRQSVVEYRNTGEQWLTFNEDHKIRFELIRLVCFSVGINNVTIGARLFDGKSTFALVALEHCHLNLYVEQPY